MFGDKKDMYDSPSSGNSLSLVGTLAAVKIIRSLAVSFGFTLLFDNDYPVLVYSFYILLGSAILFGIIQRPWSNRRNISTDQMLRISFYAVLLVLNVLLWNYGLKLYGPTRTILSSEYADLALSFIVTSMIPSKSKSPSKLQGSFLILIGYAILFLVDSSYPLMHHVVDDLNTPVPSLSAHSFHLGYITIPETKVGGVCILAAIFINVLRKNFSRKLALDIGGEKRLFSIALVIAAAIMTPLAIISHFTSDSAPTSSHSGFSVFIAMVFLAIFQIVADHQINAWAVPSSEGGFSKIPPITHVRVGLTSAFLAAWFGERLFGFSPGVVLPFVCFLCVLAGFHLLLQRRHSGITLPMFGSPDSLAHSGGLEDIFTMKFASESLAIIWNKKSSRRIFLYLIANLGFMFVEMLYGYLTNSLGLISDACHMLFDCTALAIGLIASVISARPPNKIYSYGYGRVETLSGFINGIFLVFVAVLVLKESSERFFHPQDINTDKLLLVSCLGLGVNLVGVFAFHDLHDHGDHGDEDDGHGHSHGHDHGHSHGHDHGGSNANITGVYLHILADTLGSVGVICSSLMVSYFGWTTADPVCSFCISLLIFVSVIPLLKDSGIVLLQTTPEEFDQKLDKSLNQITTLEGVVQIRNPHFWKVSKSNVIGTLHVQIRQDAVEQKILDQVTKILKKKGVKNLTVEIVK